MYMYMYVFKNINTTMCVYSSHHMYMHVLHTRYYIIHCVNKQRMFPQLSTHIHTHTHSLFLSLTHTVHI